MLREWDTATPWYARNISVSVIIVYAVAGASPVVASARSIAIRIRILGARYAE